MIERDALARFELALDPARPEAVPGAQIIGCGEISAVITLDALPGVVCKRMAGFRDDADAARYVALVERYVADVAAAGTRVVATRLLPIERPRRAPVVYLLQPRLDPAGLGNAQLHAAGDALLSARLDAILACVGALLRANRTRSDGRSITVDAQLSNWHFDAAPESAPVLLDVGTPFVRRNGAHEIGAELFLAPVPPGIRAFYRRQRAVEHYMDTFFDARRLFVDAIANFHKEGAPGRIPLAIERVNRWLAEDVPDLASRPITREDVDRYYARDAALLELYLRARRLDRFVRTRILRGRYDFVLPGAIRR